MTEYREAQWSETHDWPEHLPLPIPGEKVDPAIFGVTTPATCYVDRVETSWSGLHRASSNVTVTYYMPIPI